MSELDDHTQRLIARLRDWHARNHPSDYQCDESVAADLIAGLTARNATLVRALADVEAGLVPIRTDNDGDDVLERVRTILAGATTESPNERNHQ